MGKEILTWFGLATWLASSAIGFGLWHNDDATPGATSAMRDRIEAQDHPRIAVYLHPRCPCSRATLEELGKVIKDLPSNVEVEIVFVLPPGVEAGWERGEVWDLAMALGVRVRLDVDGLEARTAGATTSGYVIHTGASGRIVSAGGITRGRGSYGDSPGRRALIAGLNDNAARSPESPVFGCPLFASNQCAGR